MVHYLSIYFQSRVPYALYKAGVSKSCHDNTVYLLSLLFFRVLGLVYYLLRSRATRGPLLGLDVVHTNLIFGLGVIHVAVGVDHVVLVVDGGPLVLNVGFLEGIGGHVLVLGILLDVILLVLLGRALGGVGLHGLGRLGRRLGLVCRLLGGGLGRRLLHDLLDRLRLLSRLGGLGRLSGLLHDLFRGLLLGLLDRGVELLNQRLELASVLAAPHAVGLLLGVALAEAGLADLLELAAVAELVGLVVAHHLGLAALNVVLLVEGAGAAADVTLGLSLWLLLGLGLGLLGLLLSLRLGGLLGVASFGLGLGCHVVVAASLGLRLLGLGLLRGFAAGDKRHVRQELRTKLLLGKAGRVLAVLGTQGVGGEEHVVEVDHHGEGHGCLCGLVRGVRKVLCVTRLYP